jgi:uncharacterized lipoprotein YmbA
MPLVAALILVGCASTPPAEQTLLEPIDFKTIPGAPAVRDSRAAFRSVFCSTLRADLGLALAPA